MSADHIEHLGIVELHTVARGLATHHDDLFRTLGGWVSSTTEPAAQQLFAEAGHRHAWLADLWRQRIPAIPINDGVDAGDPRPEDSIDPDAADRVAAYALATAQLIASTRALDERIDPVLDPSTHRVAELTLADLDALARRIAALT